MVSRRRQFFVWALIATMVCGRLDAITLGDLLGDPKLTAKRFASHFETFAYEFHPEVQPPEVFLESRAGDCDDYAILADYVLKRHQIGTRLVRISLVGRVAHDVCYVIPNRGYLDYNNRKYASTMEGCKQRLRAIASQVADSFEANWTSASEYAYDYTTEKKVIGMTVVKTEPANRDPDA